MSDSDRTYEQLVGELAELRRRFSDLEASRTRPDAGDTSASESKYHDLYDNAPDLCFSVDTATATVAECNQTLLTRLGYTREEFVGRSIYEVYHPDCLEAVANALQALKNDGEVRDLALQVVRKDGTAVNVTLNESAVRAEDGNILRSRSTWRDVTASEHETRKLSAALSSLEQRIQSRTDELVEANAMLRKQVARREEAEEALRHSQKIDAMGHLTGGLAHDFNNLLTVIQTNATLIADDLPEEARQVRDELRDVQDAARHGAALIEKLLSFSRRGSSEMKPLDVADLIDRLTGTLRRLLPATIEVRSTIEGRPLGIHADPAAIEQIVMNLANNARDAMPQGGLLRIDAKRTALDQETCRRYGLGEAGEYVGLAVSDTGEGMDEAIRTKIFEPYFTTKAEGKGTGLGLPMILDLVRRQQGCVEVHSTVGQGTEVCLYFPIVADVAQSEAPEEEKSPSADGGGETILLIEDEESLRRAGKRVLERYGYTVLLGIDGKDGLEVFERNRGDVSLIITDVVMPRVSGPELRDLIRKEANAVKFIYTSGYSANDPGSSVAIDPTVPFVSKPWALSALVALVREVLDHRPDDSS